MSIHPARTDEGTVLMCKRRFRSGSAGGMINASRLLAWMHVAVLIVAPAAFAQAPLLADQIGTLITEPGRSEAIGDELEPDDTRNAPMAQHPDMKVELPAIRSGVMTSALVQPAWGTGAIATKAEQGETAGAFRFNCGPGHLSYDDPILYPGRPGSSHLHQWFGNTKADAYSTYESLRTSGDSTCNNLLNRSAYWIPAMLHSSGKVVAPDWLGVYYKRLPTSSPQCRTQGIACVQLPRGLRYVFGYNMLDPAKSAPADQRWWSCDAPNSGGHFATIPEAAKACPVGGRLGAVIVAPNCWNGTALDSTDHRSHMAYPSYGTTGQLRCPRSHPYIIPTFTLGAWYTNDGTAARWRLSSDDMTGAAMAAGSTLHADWFGAWEDSTLKAWHEHCIDRLLNCSGGDLGDGRQIKMTQGYSFPNKTVLINPPVKLGSVSAVEAIMHHPAAE